MNRQAIASLFVAVTVGLAAISSAAPKKRWAPPAFDGSNCEEIAFYAKDYYNIDVVFIQQLKPNGAFDFSDDGTTAHWMNAKTIHGVRYYFDYSGYLGQTIFKGKQAIIDRYRDLALPKIEIYDLGLGERPPFGIHYQWKKR